jgi:heme oxygenase
MLDVMTHRRETQIGLADHFKTATWDLHKEAETTGFINDLLRGRASRPNYVNFLHNLRLVYDAMESDTSWLKAYPELGDFISPALFRTAHLCRDISELQERTKVKFHIFPETEDYVAHIKRASRLKPEAMLAHIYVRYLGDLNGGQVMKRLLIKSLNLPEDALTFYDFNQVENMKLFKQDFRHAINRIRLSAEKREIATQAAKRAFEFNISLSKSLEKTD